MNSDKNSPKLWGYHSLLRSEDLLNLDFDLERISNALSILKEASLLTQDNFNAIKAHTKLTDITNALRVLNGASILTQANFDAIKAHTKLTDITNALRVLNGASILTQANFDAIKVHTKLTDITDALFALNEVNILTQANFDAIKAHTKLADITDALFALNEVNILTQANLDAITGHTKLADITNALRVLNGASILTQANFDAIKAHTKLTDITEALCALKGVSILTQANFDAITAHTKLADITYVPLVLNEAKIDLTQANFDVIKVHTKLSNITNVLYALNAANILTQENFDRLLDLNNQSLFSDAVVNTVWLRIPPHLLTQAVFERLIELAQQTDPEGQILQYVALLNGLDDDQSTHTASVHASVSTSAKNLWSCFGEGLSDAEIEKTVTAVKDTLSNLPDTLKNKAVKTCVQRITANNYNFIDPESKVSLKQLLAISYLAIHDAVRRIGSLEDARQQFIDGLYEVQRGYNLSAENVDDGKDDKPICIAGTFNKLIEKLCGIHSAVELIFMTKETVACKFPIIVREGANNYLKKLSKPETSKNFLDFMELIKQLLKEGIDIIWNRIKPSVADRLFDEFKSLYGSNKENPHFETLVDTGVYVELENLQDYQQSVISSPGYREYSSQMLQSNARFFSPGKTTENYLCAYRHDNAEAQRKYDQHFGLVLRK